MSGHYDTITTTTQTAGNTVVYSGCPFSPDFVLLWVSGTVSGADAITDESHKFGFGVAATATDRRCFGTQSTDASANAAADLCHRNDCCIVVLDTTGAVAGRMDYQSQDANGFTLVIDQQFPADYVVSILCLTADDVITGQGQEPGSAGDQDITALPFDPTGIVIFGVASTVAPNGATSVDSNSFIGVVGSDLSQGLISGGSDDAAATIKTNHTMNRTNCIEYLSSTAGAPNARANVSSWLSGGFRLNWVESNSTRYYHYVAWRGLSSRVVSIASRLDTTPTDSPSLGHTPEAILVLSTMSVFVTVDNVDPSQQYSVGGASGPADRGVQAMSDRDGIAASEIYTAIEYDSMFINIFTSGGLVSLMDLQSMNADTFTYVMTDTEPTSAKDIIVLSWGSPPAPGGDDLHTKQIITTSPVMSISGG